MDEVGGYLAHIDRVLAAALALFPDDGEPVRSSGLGGQWPQLSPPEGASALAGATEGAAAGYQKAGARIAALTAAIDESAATAVEDGRQARTAAAGIRETARTRAAGITPETDTPEGMVLLVSSMDERVSAMQQHIAAVREQMRAHAERIRQQAVELAAVRASS
jgi:hypothetical protein